MNASLYSLIYLGTRQGEVLQLGIDKAAMTIVWNSKLELLDENGDENISIRKMGWMFPQSPTSDGCLFVLLGNIFVSIHWIIIDIIIFDTHQFIY